MLCGDGPSNHFGGNEFFTIVIYRNVEASTFPWMFMHAQLMSRIQSLFRAFAGACGVGNTTYAEPRKLGTMYVMPSYSYLGSLLHQYIHTTRIRIAESTFRLLAHLHFSIRSNQLHDCLAHVQRTQSDCLSVPAATKRSNNTQTSKTRSFCSIQHTPCHPQWRLKPQMSWCVAVGRQAPCYQSSSLNMACAT